MRVRVSLDGRTVWVTARGSDELLAFSAARLRRDPARALLAAVRVGEAPVGLALIDRGRRILVADSNRFGRDRARSELTAVSVVAALAGRPAVLGTIAAGAFAREVARAWGRGLALVGDFGSGRLETVDFGRPRAGT